MFQVGDIIQIVQESHPWFPALLIVDEVKSWGVQAYVITPRSNDGSERPARAFNRLMNAQILKVGEATVLFKL